VPSRAAADSARRVRTIYPDPARWCPFDDTLPALTLLAESGWRHAVLSNHVPALPRFIDALGLTGSSDAIVNSACTGYEKPHPQAFRAALDAAGRPDRVWMIGHNLVADVAGANAAGIDALLVRGANPGPGVRHHAPDLTGRRGDRCRDVVRSSRRDAVTP
jgi:putative hydrolase of the HAD superfamily